MITFLLTDDTGSNEFKDFDKPMVEKPVEKSVDIVTLDNNIHTDFTGAKKREWEISWAYLDEVTYDILRGYYERQFTAYKYPRLTLDYYNVEDVPVRMTISDKQTITNCGEVADVKINLRESK